MVRLEFFVKNLDLNKRLQILIQNLVEKRKAQWKERTFSNEIPKKISELHQEYKLEQEISANINPYNRIVITSQIPLEKKPKHCIFLFFVISLIIFFIFQSLTHFLRHILK